MLEYDPITDLAHHPTPNLKRFGVNPFGESLYRIVFKDSRRHLVGKYWPDNGETGYRWVPKYPGVKTAWMLERWNSAWEFTRMSQSEWDRTMTCPISGFLLLGPYPSRGEYELAWEFDLGVAQDSLENVIGAVERGRDRTFQQIRQGHAAEYQYEEKDSRVQAEVEVRDACTYKGNAALSYGRHGRGTKTAPELRSAEELGLPIPKANRLRNPKDLRGLDVTTNLTTGRRIA